MAREETQGREGVSDFTFHLTGFHHFFGSVKGDMRLVLLKRVTANNPPLPATHVAVNASRVFSVGHGRLPTSDLFSTALTLVTCFNFESLNKVSPLCCFGIV